MFIDQKLNEMRIEILKELELEEQLQRIDQEIYECLLRKQQLHQQLETINEWKETKRFSIFRLFQNKKTIRTQRLQVSEQKVEEITKAMDALNKHIHTLLDKAQTTYHRIQEVFILMTDYEILISEKIEQLEDHPEFKKLEELDGLIKIQLDNLKRNQMILTMGLNLRNQLVQFIYSNVINENRLPFIYEQSSIYHLHQLIHLENVPVSLATITELIERFKSEIQIYHLYLPFTLEDIKEYKRDKKYTERLLDSWSETYKELNNILDYFWDETHQIKRRIRDLYQHRHSKVVPVPVNESVVS